MTICSGRQIVRGSAIALCILPVTRFALGFCRWSG